MVQQNVVAAAAEHWNCAIFQFQYLCEKRSRTIVDRWYSFMIGYSVKCYERTGRKQPAVGRLASHQNYNSLLEPSLRYARTKHIPHKDHIHHVILRRHIVIFLRNDFAKKYSSWCIGVMSWHSLDWSLTSNYNFDVERVNLQIVEVCKSYGRWWKNEQQNSSKPFLCQLP